MTRSNKMLILTVSMTVAIFGISAPAAADPDPTLSMGAASVRERFLGSPFQPLTTVRGSVGGKAGRMKQPCPTAC